MILGEIAVVLNVLSVLCICAWVMLMASPFLLHVLKRNWPQHSANTRSVLLWLFALSPWLIGSLASVIAVLPGANGLSGPAVYDYLRWHHPTQFILFDWHMALLLIAAGIGIVMVARAVLQLINSGQRIGLLKALSRADESGICHLNTPVATAFTGGFFHPTIFLTSGLCDCLNNDELAIIKLHEQAHIKQRHLIKKWLFSVFASLFPKPVSRWLTAMMTIAVEQQADAAVTRRVSDRAFIAATLLKVKRLASLNDMQGVTLLNPSHCYFFGFDAVEERITYLLNPITTAKPRFFTLLILALMLSVVGTFCADLAHHAIELLLPKN